METYYSSASYMVSLELVSDENVKVSDSFIAGSEERSKENANRIYFNMESLSDLDFSAIDSLCDMLFQNTVIEESCYDISKMKSLDEDAESENASTGEEDDWNDEEDEWDEENDNWLDEPRDYTAKELYPEELRWVKRQAQKDGITIRNLKSIIITETLYGSGDGPVWDDSLEDEYEGEVRKIYIIDVHTKTWEKASFGYQYMIFDQENGEYIDISPEDLDVTEQVYQQLSLDEAVERWLEKRGICKAKL